MNSNCFSMEMHSGDCFGCLGFAKMEMQRSYVAHERGDAGAPLPGGLQGGRGSLAAGGGVEGACGTAMAAREQQWRSVDMVAWGRSKEEMEGRQPRNEGGAVAHLSWTGRRHGWKGQGVSLVAM